MADVLPLNFPIPSESAVASYNWIDIGEGTGMVHLKLMQTSGTDYSIGTEDFYSDKIELVGTEMCYTDAVEYKTTFDTDFDMSPFNRPCVIKGTGYVNICWDLRITDGNNGTTYGKITIYVRKWDGATETEIANATTDVNSHFENGNEQVLDLVPITIPKTHFAKGEQLRVTLKGEVQNPEPPVGDACSLIVVGTDPQNRDGTYIVPSTDTPTSITKLDFYCPFEIEL